jgi:hypothetical protein
MLSVANAIEGDRCRIASAGAARLHPRFVTLAIRSGWERPKLGPTTRNKPKHCQDFRWLPMQSLG